jgi:hypothetical protein
MEDEHGDEGNVASDAIDESADRQDEAPSLPARTATSALSPYLRPSVRDLQEALEEAAHEETGTDCRTAEVADGWVVDERDLDLLRKQVVAICAPPLHADVKSLRAAGAADAT